MNTIRVVLADDHAVVRKHIRNLLQKAPGVQIVGEAGNGVEAIHVVNRKSPDILLLDMDMPVLNGVEVARELCEAGSPVQILALSAYDDEEYISALLENGAAGYLTKDEAPNCILDAIHSVASGRKGRFTQRVAEKVASLKEHKKEE
jgi:DNA-binding NarL/FixJ family response regulator